MTRIHIYVHLRSAISAPAFANAAMYNADASVLDTIRVTAAECDADWHKRTVTDIQKAHADYSMVPFLGCRYQHCVRCTGSRDDCVAFLMPVFIFCSLQYYGLCTATLQVARVCVWNHLTHAHQRYSHQQTQSHCKRSQRCDAMPALHPTCPAHRHLRHLTPLPSAQSQSRAR